MLLDRILLTSSTAKLSPAISRPNSSLLPPSPSSPSFRTMDPVFGSLQQLLSIPDDMDKLLNAPARSFVYDTKAMASTPADVKEYRDHYLFVLDMPGLKSSDIKVQIENENVLTISGERKADEKDELEAKYLRIERRMGRLMRKFPLPANANIEGISASCHDGVLAVKVPKIPPPEPKKPKAIEVTVS